MFFRDDLVVQGMGEVRDVEEASDCEIDRIFGHGFEDLDGILQSSA
jgi:hypothetical protein